ncbi:hypothetical protein JOD97_005331 [Duganella sp. 1411]|jgi:hypothetical protein|uniref:hypothetical protein n=1 Tax=Duganella sp. 1411 TaxID=2806572 RepID=UPI001AEAEBAC|nr:hypothetical protein [Duganella sp. 1411]MBP1207252.1 hypothetical protein [Duganella sp. 1411]
MNTFVKKLQRIERRLSVERGPFELFAALRPDSSLRLWDLLVTARWLDDWGLTEMRTIASQLNAEFPLPEILKFSRIAIIERDNPGLQAIHSAVQVEHGLREFRNVTFFDVRILHAYIITSRHTNAAQHPSQRAA